MVGKSNLLSRQDLQIDGWCVLRNLQWIPFAYSWWQRYFIEHCIKKYIRPSVFTYFLLQKRYLMTAPSAADNLCKLKLANIKRPWWLSHLGSYGLAMKLMHTASWKNEKYIDVSWLLFDRKLDAFDIKRVTFPKSKILCKCPKDSKKVLKELSPKAIGAAETTLCLVWSSIQGWKRGLE